MCKHRPDRVDLPCPDCGELVHSRRHLQEHRRNKHKKPASAASAPHNMGHGVGGYFWGQGQQQTQQHRVPTPNSPATAVSAVSAVPLPSFSATSHHHHHHSGSSSIQPLPSYMSLPTPTAENTPPQQPLQHQQQYPVIPVTPAAAAPRCEFEGEVALQFQFSSNHMIQNTAAATAAAPIPPPMMTLSPPPPPPYEHHHHHNGHHTTAIPPTAAAMEENFGSLLRQVYESEHSAEFGQKIGGGGSMAIGGGGVGGSELPHMTMLYDLL